MIKNNFIDYPIWHPFTHQIDNEPLLKIIKGKKSFLYDEDNKQYLDAISSWWVTLHGHGNVQIAKAIFTQAKKLEQVIFANFVHEPALQLAKQVLELFKQHFQKVFFSDNGSTSVEVAIKMALQYWANKQQQRTKVLTLKHAYHGDTFGAMSIGQRNVFSKPFHSFLFDVDAIDLENENHINELKIKNLNDYAFFIYEPLVQGAGGMKMYEAKKLNNVLSILRKHNILLIADEVMTGWGRTGKMFASDYLSNMADIICLSKGLTGGFLPLGLTLCTAQIHSAFINTDINYTFYHGHSFTANPIACACALESIKILLNLKTQNAIERISKQNKLFIDSIKDHSNVFNARHYGTIAAFEFENNEAKYNIQSAKKITKYFLNHGIFIRPLGNTIYIMPPYSTTIRGMKKIFSAIKKFLNEF